MIRFASLWCGMGGGLLLVALAGVVGEVVAQQGVHPPAVVDPRIAGQQPQPAAVVPGAKRFGYTYVNPAWEKSAPTTRQGIFAAIKRCDEDVEEMKAQIEDRRQEHNNLPMGYRDDNYSQMRACHSVIRDRLNYKLFLIRRLQALPPGQ